MNDLLYSSYRGDLSHVTSKLVIQGHIPMKKVSRVSNHIFLDTGASVGVGGRLSALLYPEFKVLTSH